MSDPISPDADPDAGEPAPPPPVSPRPATNQVDGRVPGMPRSAWPAPSNRPVEWSWWVPEVRLLEAPRIACSPVIVALALAGAVLSAGLDRAICAATAGPSPPAAFPWEEPRPARLGLPLPAATATHPATRRLLAPAAAAVGGATDLMTPDGWATALRGAARVLAALVVWGFFGTAICRTAAVRFAEGAAGSPTAAVRLAASKWIAGIGGPLLPAVGVAALALGLALLGWVGEIPAAGPWVVAALWGPALAAGLAAVILLLLAAAGWPLMLAALAAEGTDALDAFSRAFSYLVGRPLRVAVHAVVGVLIGVVAVGLAMSAAGAAAAFAGELADIGDMPAAASVIVGGWGLLWFALPAAYAAGLFWTLATVSYFLLRYADDAVTLDELWTPADPPPPGVQNESADSGVPRVGVAASDLPTIERPHAVADG